jgi:Surface antigen variable number repeat
MFVKPPINISNPAAFIKIAGVPLFCAASALLVEGKSLNIGRSNGDGRSSGKVGGDSRSWLKRVRSEMNPLVQGENMKIVSAVGILVAVMFVANLAAHAQQKLVEDLELRGHRSVSSKEIMKHIKTRPGDVYNEEQVKKDFQSVLDMGIFDPLNCKTVVSDGPRGGVIVIFELKEKEKQ